LDAFAGKRMHDETRTYPSALAAGLTADLSACILSRVSAHPAWSSRYSTKKLAAEQTADLLFKVMPLPLAFVLGLTAIDFLLEASAALPGELAIRHRQVVRIAGGLSIILFLLNSNGFICARFLGIAKRLLVLKITAHNLGQPRLKWLPQPIGAPFCGPMLCPVSILAAAKRSL
jgi:cytochrome c biogenesis protein CcdA